MADDYTASGAPQSGAPGGAVAVQAQNGPWKLDRCRDAAKSYFWNKGAEIAEQKVARRYYHGVHWTAAELKVLKKRKQPAMTFNRIARKIDGVVGLIERLRQDPKAYPRTPHEEQGAELATAALRYVIETQLFKQELSPECARDGGIEGIAGVELNLIDGGNGQPDDFDVGLDIVEPDTFIYDPKSIRLDFSDARFMGTSKLVDLELAQEMFPDQVDALAGAGEEEELSSNPDREFHWTFMDGKQKRIRLVDLWYQSQGEWYWAVFTGTVLLMDGISPFINEKNKTFAKYVMFSANVDHDGDRYGLVRNMKDAQDGINAKQSKMQHILASRRLMMRQGAVADVEQARREWARPDGVVILPQKNAPLGDDIKADDQSFDFAGWGKMLEMNLSEIENFGPNPALIGTGVDNKSGRAIALMQQAGIADLGPYILAHRGWKMRVYRAVWNVLRRYWKAERWIRVTDDEGVAQFVQINGVGVDPRTGLPAMVNMIGALDVDIIIDEGPDQMNMMADSFDTLTALASKGANIPPPVLLELAPIAASVKKKLLEMIQQAAQQPNPEVQAKQAELEFKKQDAMMGMQLQAAKAEQDAALKQRELDNKIAMQRQELDAQQELAHVKAVYDAQIKAAELAAKAENEARRVEQSIF